MKAKIKIYRSNVSIVNPIIILNKDLEKPKTEEKSKNIIVRIAKSILLLTLDFTV